ncbi:MAG TPA: NOB1 family endonuclease [Ignisphaera sp.]|nr:NOB1 family endonuclease [Ignisphaera sp.]
MLDFDIRCEAQERVLVLDTAAFLAGLQLHIYGHRLVTVPRVIEEVKDEASVRGLEMALTVNRVEVVEPKKEYREQARSIAKDVGSLTKLSETDLDVLALALQLRDVGCRVVVVTDDYSLQNTVALIGIEFQPVKSTGIKRPRLFRKSLSTS